MMEVFPICGQTPQVRDSVKILRSGTGISAPPCLGRLDGMLSGPGKLECFNDQMAFFMFSIVNTIMVRGISKVVGEV